MDERSDRGGGKDRARRFSFSWADEVEREEQQLYEQQQQPAPPPRREEKNEPAKTDPFGAARPREVVLAEKGVDWRARDRELESSRRSAACRTSRTRARGKRDVRAAAPAPTVTPRRPQADSTPAPIVHRKTEEPQPVSYRGRGERGGKRKSSGEVQARQVPQVADQGRGVLRELNIGSRGNSSLWSSKKSRNSTATQRIVATEIATADYENRGSSSRVPTKSDGSSEIGQKRMGKGRRRRRIRTNKSKKQQTLPL
ncbi:eukaryotic translation initiation factor 4B1 [Brachypodium distachyon]|uniref:Uncharacterized protein n=1 Tax=Brachypodium distachyon TaxID=15368 RepID=I1HEV9_BRADI|nr:eukaryotic translation initiation factor 4B1 [Brachypodium distachyon]KQK04100.2 hypothetical protein BRADI_2g11690v3 [Brachypodium distachyon]|eukprot:XP_014754335.1 eukaryotic translation initiation factor 4B1 [Brachypodium distachyon]